MFEKTKIAIAGLLLVSIPGAASASLMSLPKSLNAPSKPLAAPMPMWGPLTYDFKCIRDPGVCQDAPAEPSVAQPVKPDAAPNAEAKPDESVPLVRKASLFSMPKALKKDFGRLDLDKYVMGPMAHIMFCAKYPQDCQIKKMAFRGGKIEMTPERWRDLRDVNTAVNRSIRPEANTEGLAGEKWIVSPRSGDCNDYAVTKRHELLARGWPSRSLLLAVVVTSWGEHHLILVVRSAEGDYVLDNLSATVRHYAKVPYQWVKVQSPKNPRYWTAVRSVRA